MDINTFNSCTNDLVLSSDAIVFPITMDCVIDNSYMCSLLFYQGDYNSFGHIVLNDQFDLNTLNGESNDGYIYLSSGTYHLENYGFDSCLLGIITEGQESDNWSSIFINDIQHQSASNINITIPEEINWDYTNTGDNFDLVISGYNVDTQYMQDILTVQSYHPSSEDFTESFVSTVSLMFPYIVICLFIMFLWKLIKKIFK